MSLINVLINSCKMATPQERTQCESWFFETKSDVQTQRKYRTKYGKDPPLVLGQCWIQLEVDDQEHLAKLCLLLKSSHFARVY